MAQQILRMFILKKYWMGLCCSIEDTKMEAERVFVNMSLTANEFITE